MVKYYWRKLVFIKERRMAMEEQEEKRNYASITIGAGIFIGLLLGFIIQNMMLGIFIGSVIGIITGMILNKRWNNQNGA